MFAYTTFTSFVYRPSLIEVLVYLAGLLAVIAIPSLLFNYLESNKTRKAQEPREVQRHS